MKVGVAFIVVPVVGLIILKFKLTDSVLSIEQLLLVQALMVMASASQVKPFPS